VLTINTHKLSELCWINAAVGIVALLNELRMVPEIVREGKELELEGLWLLHFVALSYFFVLYISFSLLKGLVYRGYWLVEAMNEKLLMDHSLLVSANLQTHSSIHCFVNRLVFNHKHY